MKIFNASFILLMLVLPLGSANALTDDFTKQAKISSDKWHIDLQKNIAVYTGNVHIRQGSIEITAQRLEIYNHGKSGQEQMVLIGSPARFSQRIEDGTLISAQAKEIRFERHTNILKLLRQAKVTWGKNITSGDYISYDMVRKSLNADGDSTKNKQVITILQPTKKKNK
ncbi:MAG: lipopolysaccharide transport periplasmic protein LptA [Psychrobium sp.]|nr:lipopolysaccharide transport periplasmic protein LptA [Psychrobium sp.]